MFHAPSQDSNLKTKGLTLAASLQSNLFNVLKFGSPKNVVLNYLSARKILIIKGRGFRPSSLSCVNSMSVCLKQFCAQKYRGVPISWKTRLHGNARHHRLGRRAFRLED